MIQIDGSIGGGQILRSSLALSMATGKPFRIFNIRKARQKPGLQRQHLTAVDSSIEICNAKATGNILNSTAIEFHPGKIIPGNYLFNIGTAGSTTLVLQTLLSPLALAGKPSKITVTGGTENPMAPPSYDFQHLFLSVLKHYGIETRLDIIKHGYYPKGGGKLELYISPAKEIKEMGITGASEIEKIDVHIESSTSLQKASVSERICNGFRENFRTSALLHEHLLYSESLSPGCYIHAHVHYARAKPGVTVLGKPGKRAEDVGKECARKLSELVYSRAPVDEHTADQLLIYMALAGSGRILTNNVTEHARANIQVIEKFLDVKFEIKDKLITCRNL